MVAPLIFRPPECYDESLCKNLEGSQCDIWLYGLTDDWPTRRMSLITDVHSWKTYIESVLMQALKKRKLCENVRYAFPCFAISDGELVS